LSSGLGNIVEREVYHIPRNVGINLRRP
jgi:hypothetical protein